MEVIMDLNPGQWTLCYVLKCKDLKGNECTGKCQYKTESEKFKAFNRMRASYVKGVNDKQNAPVIAAEKAKFEAKKAKNGGRS
jgi:hypothetical protein